MFVKALRRTFRSAERTMICMIIKSHFPLDSQRLKSIFSFRSSIYIHFIGKNKNTPGVLAESTQ